MTNKLKLTNLILAFAVVASLASCNDGDDYKTLSREEKAQCFQAVRGSYTGKLVYATGETKNGRAVTDTLDARWEVTTDSTLTIKQVPSRLLATYVTNSALREALSSAPAQDIVCRTYYAQLSPVGFYLNPVTPTYQLHYGDADHKVQVAFYTNTSMSSGIYNASSQVMQMQIAEGAIYIDSKLSSDLKTASGFQLKGKKL